MYRAKGPEAFRPVGEVEFANGTAAMSASGGYGPAAVFAGIVGCVICSWATMRGRCWKRACTAHDESRSSGFRSRRGSLRLASLTGT